MKNVSDLPKKIEDLKKVVAMEREENNLLREQIRLLKAKLFGRKSEKGLPIGDDQQMALDLGLENLNESDGAPDPDETSEIAAHRRKKPGRKPLPEALLREHVYHQVPENERVCGCGAEMKAFGEDLSEELDYVPAQLKVIVHHREKPACKACEGIEAEAGEVKTAPGPSRLIPQGMATHRLMAHALTEKFVYSLPFYRQESRFQRMGIELGRATMCNWALRIAEKAKILWELLLDKAKTQGYLQIDETTVQVMKEPGRSNKTKSYMWVIRGGPPDRPSINYIYHPTRSSSVPRDLLGSYQGYVQTDGYAGYNVLEKSGAKLLACMTHARRKFTDIHKAGNKKAPFKGLNAEAIQFFKRLYRIETECRENHLSPEAVKARRAAESLPILETFKVWLDKHSPSVPPSSLLGKAMKYSLGLWPRLIRYIEDGRLQIDNNLIENSIRPFVLGRKNWLLD